MGGFGGATRVCSWGGREGAGFVGNEGELCRNAAHTEMTLKLCKRSKCLRLLERIVKLCRIAVAPMSKSRSPTGRPVALNRPRSLAKMRQTASSTGSTSIGLRKPLSSLSLCSGSLDPNTPSNSSATEMILIPRLAGASSSRRLTVASAFLR